VVITFFFEFLTCKGRWKLIYIGNANSTAIEFVKGGDLWIKGDRYVGALKCIGDDGAM
jgi:hypothetical protein